MEYRYTQEAKSCINEYELRCSVCKLVCTNPVNCPQGHDHCQDCIVSSQCAICPAEGCEATIDLNNLHANYVAKKMIDSLKIYCPNRDINHMSQDEDSHGGGNDRGDNGSDKRKRNVKFVE